jgi:GT2 family glycosyltransferase
VVLVAGEGLDRVRACLAALSRQTHPRLGVLAVDDASPNGSADFLRSSLGDERVIRLPEAQGFARAVAAGLRSEAAAHADYVLLMRDDTVLAPGAIGALVEAAERVESVGVVGPKVLDADDPSILRDIGESIDLFGHAYSPLERGEIDQGQYDRIREVFSVSSAAMLVSMAAVARAGGPDERLGADLDAMDLCWRIRLAGFRILWTPAAVAVRAGGPKVRDQDGARVRPTTTYERERSAIASMLKDYGLLSLLWVLPLAFGVSVLRVLSYLLTRRFEDAYQVGAAWAWNVSHLVGTARRRARAQSVRVVPDRRIRQLMTPTWVRANRWSRTVVDAFRPAAFAAAGEARPSTWTRVRAAAGAHPVAFAWVLAVVVAAIAYRHLLTAPVLTGGSLAQFPSSPGGFFQEFASGLRHTALGGTAPASPALPMLGVASVLSLARPFLAQKIILLVLPALAAVGSYRALRSIPVGRMGAVLGSVCYALSPVVLWGLSEGLLPELVFLAGLPWLASRLIGFFGSNPPRRRIRWIVGAAVGLAALGCFVPGAFVAALIVTAVAVLFPGGGGRLVGLARAALAVVGAAALAWPVVSGIAGSGGRSLGGSTGVPTFPDALRTVIGSAPGDWALAFFLPIAAALGLGFASGRLRRPAARSLLMAIAGVYLAWAAGNGWLPPWFSNPAVFAALAAFGMASLVGMGTDSVVEGLHRRSFGIAQVGSAALIAVLSVGVAGQALQAARGAWHIGGADRISPAYAAIQPEGMRAYRILWIGRPLGGAFPAPGGAPSGIAGAGTASIRFGVTAPAGASAYDFGRPLDGAGYDALGKSLSAIMRGPTRHGGALLAPFGIRYVVAGAGDLPAPSLARLLQQLDIVGSSAAGLVVFHDTVAAPLNAVIADPTWRRAAVAGTLESTAQLESPKAFPLRGSDGRFGIGPFGAESPSPGGSIVLSQEFDGHWRLAPSQVADVRTQPSPSSAAPSAAPRRAFGWSIAFPYRPSDNGGSVTFTGQGIRTAMVIVLALLWAAALWITRRPSRQS